MTRVVPESEQPDPLVTGPRKTWSAYVPAALIDELKRASALDGYGSVSDYVVALLVYALRQREAERLKDLRRK